MSQFGILSLEQVIGGTENTKPCAFITIPKWTKTLGGIDSAVAVCKPLRRMARILRQLIYPDMLEAWRAESGGWWNSSGFIFGRPW